MIRRYAEGGNFTIDLEDGVARCCVVSRPELDSALCAAMARIKIDLFVQLAASASAHAMLLDLSKAPTVTGPETQAALEGMMRPWEEASKPFAVLLSAAPIQKLQFTRLLGQLAPTVGALFYTEAAARNWMHRQGVVSVRPSGS